MPDDRREVLIRPGRRLRPVKSLTRAMTLLDTLALHPEGMGVSDLATETGFSKTATYNLVTTLETGGLIRRDGENRYQLGWRMLEFGQVVRRHSAFGEISLPHLLELSEKVGETAFVSILDGDTTLCLEMAESRRSLPSGLAPGRRASVDADAAGAVLVANASPRRRRRYLQERPSGAAGAALATRLQSIRTDGYGVSYEDAEPDQASVAVPVIDHTGEVVAALGIAGPRSRLTRSRVDELLPELHRAAEGISTALGASAPASKGAKGRVDDSDLGAASIARR